MKSHTLTTIMLSIFLSVSCVSTKTSAIRQGEADAQKEVSEDNLAFEIYGLRTANKPSKSDESLKSRGIELRPVAGCIVNDEIIGHAQGFNRVMKKAIQDKYKNLDLDGY